MKAHLWFAAAAASLVAHGAAAAWIETKQPATKRVLPPIEMQLAAAPKKHVEPPPPPPPPPPIVKPVLVKHLSPRPTPPAPAAPPPPQAPKIGVDESATAATSEIAVATGVTQEGEPGTGASMDKTPAPPTPPEPPAPAAKPTGKHFVPIYQVTRMPKAKTKVSPEIPEAFRQAEREALVVVEVELDARGHVQNAKVVRHAEFGLDDAALAAAKQTEFEPALVGTEPVPVRYQIPYRFKVH